MDIKSINYCLTIILTSQIVYYNFYSTENTQIIYNSHQNNNFTKPIKYGYHLNQVNEKFYGGHPFQQIVDNSGKQIKVAAVMSPLNEINIKYYHQLRNDNYTLIGITSYGVFPAYNPIDAEHDIGTKNQITPLNKQVAYELDGWLSCFKNPDILPPHKPRILMSESDLPHPSIQIKQLSKKYDIIYSSGGDDDWHAFHKNWNLAKKCFQKIINKYKNIQILVLGRHPNSQGNLISNKIEYRQSAPYEQFLDLIEQSKISFFPAVSDASPRVLTESLMKNTPILVNEKIVGGWKYVNPQTGMNFMDEFDVLEKVDFMLQHEYKAHEWMTKNYYFFPNDIKQQFVYKKDIQLQEFVEQILQSKNNN